MAITGHVYGNAYKGFGMGRFDFTSKPLYIALFNGFYTPNYNVNETFSELTSGQVVGSGYTAGGQALTGVSWTYVAQCAVLTCAATSFSATVSCRYAVVYQYNATPSLAYLLTCVDFGVSVSTRSGSFPLSFPNGLFALNS